MTHKRTVKHSGAFYIGQAIRSIMLFLTVIVCAPFYYTTHAFKAFDRWYDKQSQTVKDAIMTVISLGMIVLFAYLFVFLIVNLQFLSSYLSEAAETM